jgi:hypothetical protein
MEREPPRPNTPLIQDTPNSDWDLRNYLAVRHTCISIIVDPGMLSEVLRLSEKPLWQTGLDWYRICILLVHQ